MVSSVPLAPRPTDTVRRDAACCVNGATPRPSVPPAASAIRTLTNSLYAALRRRGKSLATAKSLLTQS